MSPTDRSPHCLVFDSGMGGLTVVAALRQLGFKGRLSYAADTGFFPYGNKSDADLTRRIPRFADALFKAASPDILVIACNTASTLALQIVREVLPIPVVGTVPAIKPAAQMTRTGVIGVLATPGTLRRAYTDALVHEFARDRTVLTYGSVQLVELSERRAAGYPVSDEEIKAELDQLFLQPAGDLIDTVVLACTHFPLLRADLERMSPPGISFIDSGDAIARRTLNVLGDIRAEAVSGPETLYISRTDAPYTRLETVARQYGFEGTQILKLD